MENFSQKKKEERKKKRSREEEERQKIVFVEDNSSDKNVKKVKKRRITRTKKQQEQLQSQVFTLPYFYDESIPTLFEVLPIDIIREILKHVGYCSETAKALRLTCKW